MIPRDNSTHSKAIVSALRQIMQHMDHHSRKLDKDYGITTPQIMCLREMQGKTVLTLSALSKNVHLTASTLVGVIDRLEEKGFVKRTRDTEDRRMVYISLTEKGEEFMHNSPYSLDKKLEVLAEHEQRAIVHSLDRLAAVLKL